MTTPITRRALLAIFALVALMAYAMRPARADALEGILGLFHAQAAAPRHPAHMMSLRTAGAAHIAGAAREMRASWYGAGKITPYEPSHFTASGERFNRWDMTAAHRTLPFGTLLNVCFAACAIVRVNDRGPAKWTGRALDLSKGAALRVGLHRVGSGAVRVAVLTHGAVR